MTERTVTTNGVDLHVVDEGPDEGPVVVLAHGFPELAWSWRHQIPALAAAGYRVLAPDQRGYGRSSRPEEITDYDIVHLTDDLLGLLDDVDAERAVFVGHDWGSLVVWQLSLLHPERVRGVVGMSVPFLPRGPMAPLEMLRSVIGENFFYILYFQEPGVADAELGADAATTMRRMLCGLTTDVATQDPDAATRMFAPGPEGFVERMAEPEGLPPWLTPDELDHYVAEFTRTGFTGGINWYRNFDRNWETAPEIGVAKVERPCLMVTAQWDWALRPEFAAGMPALCPDLEMKNIARCGHWTQQEKPDELNAIVSDWLARRYRS
jgi:pimeloyl-ACP methyl ester carboxylesterase